MNRDPALMGLIRSTVGHPFGTIKAWILAPHFRMRRLGNVRTGMAFHLIADSIKCMIALIGVQRILAAIPV